MATGGAITAFSFDVTPYLNRRGSQELVVRVSDPTDTGLQARGKQVQEPGGIYYTPVTGIWQNDLAGSSAGKPHHLPEDHAGHRRRNGGRKRKNTTPDPVTCRLS